MIEKSALAHRMKPKTLEEFFGQEEIVERGSFYIE